MILSEAHVEVLVLEEMIKLLGEYSDLEEEFIK
jgi:hypothetical protein